MEVLDKIAENIVEMLKDRNLEDVVYIMNKVAEKMGWIKEITFDTITGKRNIITLIRLEIVIAYTKVEKLSRIV